MIKINNKKNGFEKVGIVSVVAGSIALLVFSPVLTFAFAYLGGMILDWIVGENLVNGLNLILIQQDLREI